MKRHLLVLSVLVGAAAAARAADREITLVNIKYQGKVMWMPGTIICREGETVKLTLINNVPDDPPVHGFSIPAFGVKAEVEREKPATLEFRAANAGLFETNCQLHPAHVHGQLLVLGGK